MSADHGGAHAEAFNRSGNTHILGDGDVRLLSDGHTLPLEKSDRLMSSARSPPPRKSPSAYEPRTSIAPARDWGKKERLSTSVSMVLASTRDQSPHHRRSEVATSERRDPRV